MNQPCVSIPTLMLDQVKRGEHVTLLSVQCNRGIMSRMSSLGFTPGVEIEMMQNFGHGPMVVNLRGTRVALGRGEARKILVQKGETL
ncbi:MAG: ferrous iron transport protein A [Anaerolineaceae bacterium]